MNQGSPYCFPVDLWVLWKQAARIARPPTCRFNPWCSDCTPEYQALMLAEERCGHPEVQFRLDEDGMLEGYITPSRNGKYIPVAEQKTIGLPQVQQPEPYPE